MTAGRNDDPGTYAIIGACMAVHAELGCGFLERVYQEALKCEFVMRGIPFRAEVDLPIIYRAQTLPCTYRADFICFEQVIVETKAIRVLTDVERAQTIHYLKATRFGRALLVNFGAKSLQYERFVGPAWAGL